MSTLITRLANTGTFSTNGIFDEITLQGGSLSFNGSTGYRALSIASLSTITGTGTFTIEAWVYPLDYTDQVPISRPPTAGDNTQIFRLNEGGNTTSPYGISIYDNGTQLFQNIGSGTYPVKNQWTHLAWVKNGTTNKLYINGVSSATYTGNVPDITPNQIGYLQNYAYPFNGYLTNIRIVNGTAVYTSNFNPPTQPLTAITNTVLLLDATTADTVITDSSTNGYTVTNSGAGATPSLVAYSSSTPFPPERYSIAGYLVSGILDEVTNSTQGLNPITTGSISFNGSSSLSVSANSLLNITTGSPFTIEAFIYPTAGGVTQFVMAQDDGGSNGQCFQFRLISPGAIPQFIYFTGSGRTATTITGSTSATLNVWNHLVVSYDSTVLRILLNGAVINSTATAPSRFFSASVATGIGNYSPGVNNSRFKGYMTDIRVSKGVARYNSAYSVPLLPFINDSNAALLLLSQNSGNYLIDSSSNSLTVNVATGTFSFSSLSPFLSSFLPQKRITKTGNCFISGIFDEVTGIS